MSVETKKQTVVAQVISDLLASVNNFLENVMQSTNMIELTNIVRSTFVKLLLFGGFKISDVKLMTSLSTNIFPSDIFVDVYDSDFSIILNWILRVLQRTLLKVDIDVKMYSNNTLFLFTFISHNGIITIPDMTLSITHVSDEINKICNPVVRYSDNKIIYPYDKENSNSFYLSRLRLFIHPNTNLGRYTHLLVPYAEILRILIFSTHGKVNGSMFQYFNGCQNIETTYVEQQLYKFPKELVNIVNSYISPCINQFEQNSPSEFCSNFVLQIDSKTICFNCILSTLRQIIFKKKDRVADTFNVNELSRLCNRELSRLHNLELSRLCSRS